MQPPNALHSKGNTHEKDIRSIRQVSQPPLQVTLHPTLLLFIQLLIDVEPPHSVQIDHARIHPTRAAVVDPGGEIYRHDSHDADVVGKEVLRAGLLAKRPDAEIEFHADQDDAPAQSPPRAPRPRPRPPGEIGRRATLDLPGVAHADVGQADHAPAEQGQQGGEVREPGEDVDTSLIDVEVGETATDDESRDKAKPGTTHSVGFAKELQDVSEL